ncbi:MAG: acyl-CoA-binding protein [Myxococcota bacterium]
MSMKQKFEAAVEKSKTLPPQPTPVQLDMYGLFKQATIGDVSGGRPGMLDVRGRAKWDAWDKRRGMEEDDAMEAYVKLVEKLGNFVL